jgi:hypothetical protein
MTRWCAKVRLEHAHVRVLCYGGSMPMFVSCVMAGACSCSCAVLWREHAHVRVLCYGGSMPKCMCSVMKDTVLLGTVHQVVKNLESVHSLHLHVLR